MTRQPPIDILRTLSTDKHSSVREGVGRNLATPTDILCTLAIDKRSSVRQGAGGNPATPTDILRTLAIDNEDVRRGVARNPATPIDILRSLATDNDEIVRQSVGGNPATPTDFIRALATVQNAAARLGVSGNPATPIDILRTLATVQNDMVRLGLSGNPAAPIDILRTLATDNEEVCMAVGANVSAGQDQRVSIGAVLTSHPKVLVLDEPTSALDPRAAEEVLAALQRRVHDLGVTVALAEHRLERVVQFADRVIFVPGDAQPLVIGTPAEVMHLAPIAPPAVELGRLAGWSPLPLTVRDARRAAGPLRDLLVGHTPPLRAINGGLGSESLVETTDLTVRYGQRPALRSVSLTVRTTLSPTGRHCKARCGQPADRNRRSGPEHVGLRHDARAGRERHRGHSHPLAQAGRRHRRRRRATR